MTVAFLGYSPIGSISQAPTSRVVREGGNFLTNGQGMTVSTRGLIERNQFLNFGENELVQLMGAYFSLSSLLIVRPLTQAPAKRADVFMTFLGPRQVVVSQALGDESLGRARRLRRKGIGGILGIG